MSRGGMVNGKKKRTARFTCHGSERVCVRRFMAHAM